MAQETRSGPGCGNPAAPFLPSLAPRNRIPFHGPVGGPTRQPGGGGGREGAGLLTIGPAVLHPTPTGTHPGQAG